MPDLDPPTAADRGRVALSRTLDVPGMARAYGWRRVVGATPVALGAGRDAVWRVAAVDHSGSPVDAAVKVLHPETRANDTVGLERCLADEARAFAAGVPMPELLFDVTGRGYAVTAGGNGSWDVRLVARRWVENVPVTYGELEEIRTPTALDVARALAALHALPAEPDPELIIWTQTPIESATWRDLSSRAVAQKAVFASGLRARLGALADIGELISAAPPSANDRLTHNDCAPHNAIRPTAGTPRTMLVDWDACSGGSAQREFVAAVLRFSDVPGLNNRDTLARAMVATYREAGGVLAPVVLTDAAVLLAGMTHWLRNRLDFALGLTHDGRTTVDVATDSVVSMLGWVDSIADLPSQMRALENG